MHRLPALLLLLAIAALAIVPTSANAQAEPDAIEDPVEAVEPDVVVENDVPAVDGFDEDPVPAAPAPTPAPEAAAGAMSAPPAAQAVDASAQLPFTGIDWRQLVQLFLVGSVLVSGGAVSIAWARARTDVA